MYTKEEAVIEAVLFTMGDSVEASKLAAALDCPEIQVIQTVRGLQQKYEEEGRGLKIIELDGAFQMCTRAEMYESIIRVAKQPYMFLTLMMPIPRSSIK